MAKRASVKIAYEVLVTDKEGQILSLEKKSCRSLLKNFALWVYAFFQNAYGGTTLTSISDTIGSGQTIGSGNTSVGFGYCGGMQAPASNQNYGIVVGSAAVAPTPTDYQLGTQILHGTGGSQLVHNAQSIEAVAVVGSVSSFRMTRTFTNNSAGAITVNEIGMYTSIINSSSVQKYFCVCKDLLVSPQSVPIGATLTVRYTVKVTT